MRIMPRGSTRTPSRLNCGLLNTLMSSTSPGPMRYRWSESPREAVGAAPLVSAGDCAAADCCCARAGHRVSANKTTDQASLPPATRFRASSGIRDVFRFMACFFHRRPELGCDSWTLADRGDISRLDHRDPWLQIVLVLSSAI